MPSIGISDTSGAPISVISGADTVDVVDTNFIDASSANIPASASDPLTIVTSLADVVNQVQCADTTGEYIGLYTNSLDDNTWATGTADLECIFGPGCDQTVPVQITASRPLGIRNMKNAVISVGDFALNFIK